jgi:branched-chain amino acid transport system substrate-binding protein
MSIRRRTVLQGMLTTTAAVAMPAVARAQGAPLKVGLMTVKTGPLAQGGIQMEQGIATFLKEKNGAFGSRKVELLVADTGGNPAGAKTKAQELLERDKVDVILGPLAAFELLAITDYVRERQTPMLSRIDRRRTWRRNTPRAGRRNPWPWRRRSACSRGCRGRRCSRLPRSRRPPRRRRS